MENKIMYVPALVERLHQLGCNRVVFYIFRFRRVESLPDGMPRGARPSCLLVARADGLGARALVIPFTFLPDLAVSKGVEPSNAAFLISAAGVKTSDQILPDAPRT